MRKGILRPSIQLTFASWHSRWPEGTLSLDEVEYLVTSLAERRTLQRFLDIDTAELEPYDGAPIPLRRIGALRATQSVQHAIRRSDEAGSPSAQAVP